MKLRFTCSHCAQIHEGMPSFSFDRPWQISRLAADEMEKRTVSTSETYIVSYENDVDYFLRALLEIPIIGNDEPFMWGVWGSVSAASFADYNDSDRGEKHQGNYFSWFSSLLPGYPETVGLKCSMQSRSGGLRPVVMLAPSDHPLAIDQRDGISLEKAQLLFEYALHQGKQ